MAELSVSFWCGRQLVEADGVLSRVVSDPVSGQEFVLTASTDEHLRALVADSEGSSTDAPS